MQLPEDLSSRLPRFLIFRDLAGQPELLRELAAIMKPAVFEMRDLIIDESRSEDRIFFLLSGKVQIHKRDSSGTIVPIGNASSESYPQFGESILLGRAKKSASVVAHSQCLCATLAASDFNGVVERHPAAAASIYKNLAGVLFDRLAKANRDLLILGLG